MALSTQTNLAGFKAMFERFGFEKTSVAKLVDEEGIKYMEMPRRMTEERRTKTLKAICYPGGTLC